MTLLELIIVCAILMVLASAAMPVARYTVRRNKEAELRLDLREMRDAIDRYKDAADRNMIRVEVDTDGYPPDLDTLVAGVDVSGPAPGAGITAGGVTVGGVTVSGATIAGIVSGQSGSAATPFGAPGTSGSGIPPFGSAEPPGSNAGTSLIRHVRFLRRVPVDPMTGKAEWGMRSVQDDPDSTSWGGKDLFDVFSLSTGTALDGTLYKNW